MLARKCTALVGQLFPIVVHKSHRTLCCGAGVAMTNVNAGFEVKELVEMNGQVMFGERIIIENKN